jgi:predicted RNA-binding Zn ribbon-like protein
MRDRRYCFFHQRERKSGARRAAEHRRQRWFESVDLNDARAVQKALREVLQRLLEGRIPKKKAAEIIGKLRISPV